MTYPPFDPSLSGGGLNGYKLTTYTSKEDLNKARGIKKAQKIPLYHNISMAKGGMLLDGSKRGG
jgi:hypothetical protein